MLPLQCQVQRYAWGKRGAESMVARIKKAAEPSFNMDPSESFAEFWIGTHPSGPSMVASSGEPLEVWLQRNPGSLGRALAGYSADSLVFLMKVLSIRTALSIQAHPDKKLAQQLFIRDPEHYKDPNHKPEMVIALSPFEAMCGFRPVSEIKTHIKAYPELAALIGQDVVTRFADPSFGDGSSDAEKHTALRDLFTKFMTADDSLVSSQVDVLIQRISSGQEGAAADDLIGQQIADIADINGLMCRLSADFPGDIGVMCPLFLNCVKLSPGHSFFCGPSEPHAYISGDCIECMAPSDNVIRSGLTPKFKDVDVLCDMLTYSNGKLRSAVIPSQLNEHTTLYRPPVQHAPEFEVERCKIPAGGVGTLIDCGVASIVLVISGLCNIVIDDSTPLNRESAHVDLCECVENATGGSVLFISAHHSVRVAAIDDVELFRAHINLTHG